MSTVKPNYIVFATAAILFAIQTARNGLLVGAIAVIPVIGWLWFFCLRTPGQKSHILKGMLCLSAAYIAAPTFVLLGESLNTVFASIVGADPLAYFILRAGVIEELAKFAGLLVVVSYIAPDSIKHPTDGVTLAAAAALGFALHENFFHNLHLVEQTTGKAFLFFLLGALVRVPLHVLYASIWGSAFGLGRFLPSPRRNTLLATGLAGAMFLHGLWDTLAQSNSALSIIALVLLYGVAWYGYLRVRSAVEGCFLTR